MCRLGQISACGRQGAKNTKMKNCSAFPPLGRKKKQVGRGRWSWVFVVRSTPPSAKRKFNGVPRETLVHSTPISQGHQAIISKSVCQAKWMQFSGQSTPYTSRYAMWGRTKPADRPEWKGPPKHPPNYHPPKTYDKQFQGPCRSQRAPLEARASTGQSLHCPRRLSPARRQRPQRSRQQREG